MKNKITDKSYHEVLVPLEDVYCDSGPNAFSELANKKGQTNLILVPEFVINDLNLRTTKFQDYGALDTANFLTSKSLKIIKNEDNVTIYSVPGADIAVVHNCSEKNYSSFKTTIEEKFKISNERNEMQFVTNNPFESIRITGQRLRAEKAEFLLADESWLKKGILLSDPDFEAALYQSKGTMKIKDALNHFDALYPNQFIKLSSGKYARVTGDLEKNEDGEVASMNNMRVQALHEREYSKQLSIGADKFDKILNIGPRDMDQYLALQYGLLDPNITVMYVTGGASSGKTVISYAAALDQVLSHDQDIKDKRGYGSDFNIKNKRGLYEKIALFKSIDLMGGSSRDVGFLPGKLYEKISNFLTSFEDAHNLTSVYDAEYSFEDMFRHPKMENQFGSPRKESDRKIDGRSYLPTKNEVISLTYSAFTRGRTFDNTVMLIDETQNFTAYEAKTLIEREGNKTKVIIMGDTNQIDNVNNTRDKNGLTITAKHYLDKPYACLIHLSGRYRGIASKDASKINVYNSRIR